MNDQTGGLVDTALVRSHALPVEEIAGGCFCCRFDSLVQAAERLDRSTSPDVFLAEPVGSCTDLNATVAVPLRALYGDQYRVAPLSVLLDPDRALRVLEIEPGRSFSPKVLYVYRKQLEEADVLVINKIDTTPRARVAALREALERLHPRARILQISARTGAGVPAWIDGLLAEDGRGRLLEIDYDEYADGEACLGWLNCTATVDGHAVDADGLLLALAGRIHRAVTAEGLEIAHLKLTLTPRDGTGISVVNAVSADRGPELAFALDAEVDGGDVTLNLRAEADPDRLESTVRRAFLAEGRDRRITLAVRHLERFRPARPVPTHRMPAPAG